MANRSYRTLDQVTDLRGKRVLVRVDFNVPVNSAGEITDQTRINGALPTLRELLEQGARVVIMSHRGRPKEPNSKDSLNVVVPTLQAALKCPVRFVDQVVGERAVKASQALLPGEVLVLENLRFDPREKANDPEFSRQLASLADLYVNDAFGTAHRKDASIVGVPQYIPSYVGRLMERELHALGEILGNPARPYWAIIGGAKVSDKVTLLTRLVGLADGLVIGGGMANTFLAAQGYRLGASKVEPEAVQVAREILDEARSRNVSIVLPVDLVVATAFQEDAPNRVTTPDRVQEDEMALDVGPRSVEAIETALSEAKTVLWNGPMGVFEWERFAGGTLGVARILAEIPAAVVVGGGDSVAAASKAGVKDRLTHVSTGGGATLEFLEGKVLPGIEVLLHD